jgi:hypothetical protein
MRYAPQDVLAEFIDALGQHGHWAPRRERPSTVKPDAGDNQSDDDEAVFWRNFITWWAQDKTEPVPARAWEALELAQRRAARRHGQPSEIAGGVQ